MNLKLQDLAKRARESHLRVKARREAEIAALGLTVADVPDDVLAAVEADCKRYREMRIAVAVRRTAEARLAAKKQTQAA